MIAPSFGDIFAGNAVQNGLLTAIVSDDEAAEIMAALNRMPQLSVTVELGAAGHCVWQSHLQFFDRSSSSRATAERLGRYRAH